MSFESRYKNLNHNQKQAVDTIDGPVMVVAGPGTGKTELLSMRAANILKKTDTLPENILCLTFTESGQAAMRQRLVDIIGKDAYKVAIHTFHSFGSEIIGQNREYFYQSALFQPADELRQYEVLRSIFEELGPNNPLASMMNGEYTHLNDAQAVISELKRRSALTSDELLAIIQQNETTLDIAERLICPVLDERVDKSTAKKLQPISDELKTHASTMDSIYQITPLASVMSQSLDATLEEAAETESTKPITAWKNKWLERDASKTLVFKDRKRLEKLRALSHIYYEYLNRMEKLSLFDFDDMIMQVVHAINVNNDLRFNLQEKYLYIMVDEFQDTNPAQMRILNSLTDNPVNEGSPNIMVVGDDDQAIYSFQGADISNILAFSSNYPTIKRVVLTQNYRSGPQILAASSGVIAQATDRLKVNIDELDKNLEAQPDVKDLVQLWHAPSTETERLAISSDIAKNIKSGADASKIAVLARRHSDIQALLPYLAQAGVPVRYEREESVLDSPPIIALDQLARVVVALAEGRHNQAQALLPEVLAHPAWGIKPEELWRLSLDAYNNRQNWLETMAVSPRFLQIHAWLVELATEASSTPLEPLIDKIIGRPKESTVSEDSLPAQKVATSPEATPETLTSPYFNYFFNSELLDKNPDLYLKYLSALRSIRSRLREYKQGERQPKQGETLSQNESNHTLKSFVDFIDLHRRLGVPILTHQYSAASDARAVQLLTAHKAKGLEFDTVYVLHSTDKTWGNSASSRNRSINYPENLPLQTSGNTADERLRLYYVAMTRARHNLILSYSELNDNGKNTPLANFLLSDNIPTIEVGSGQLTTEVLAAELDWYQPLTQTSATMAMLLAPQLEKFKLSATSFNAFLDVSRGGPKAFLLNNLLHFPETKSPSASYGTAVHATMQAAQTHLLATGEQKPLEDILHDFEVFLKNERLDNKDFTFYLQKGSDQLTQFLTSGVLPITSSQKSEVNFKNQDVSLNGARITGSLDLIDLNTTDRTMVVTDYKTGKPASSWDSGDPHTKLKLHKYRQQLLFYKLLVENSGEYSNYNATSGQLAFIEPDKTGQSIVLALNLDSPDLERIAKLIEVVWDHIINLNLPDTSGYSPDLKGMLDFEQDLLDKTI